MDCNSLFYHLKDSLFKCLIYNKINKIKKILKEDGQYLITETTERNIEIIHLIIKYNIKVYDDWKFCLLRNIVRYDRYKILKLIFNYKNIVYCDNIIEQIINIICTETYNNSKLIKILIKFLLRFKYDKWFNDIRHFSSYKNHVEKSIYNFKLYRISPYYLKN
jgi:hypothetical protein